MKPKTASILALSLMAVAGGIIWKGMPDDDPPARGVAAEMRAGKASDRGESAPAGHTPQGGQGFKMPSKAFAQTSKHQVTDLGLSDAQAGVIEEVFARREKQLESILAASASGGAEDYGKIFALLRNEGLRDDLVAVLSPQQLAAFDEREAKRKRETIEARAYRDMAEVSAVVRLTDRQKQEVLGALMRNAPEKLEKEADARALMSLTYGPIAADMNPADIRSVANLINMDPTGTPNFDYGSMEYMQRIERQKAERIALELSALKNVLTENQLARYREHLQKQPH